MRINGLHNSSNGVFGRSLPALLGTSCRLVCMWTPCCFLTVVWEDGGIFPPSGYQVGVAEKHGSPRSR